MKKRWEWAVQLPSGEIVWRFFVTPGGWVKNPRAEAELALKNLEGGKGKVVKVLTYY